MFPQVREMFMSNNGKKKTPKMKDQTKNLTVIIPSPSSNQISLNILNFCTIWEEKLAGENGAAGAVFWEMLLRCG